MEPSKNIVPKHVGIILDGNRRFAKKLMLKPWKGHEWGAGKVEKLFDWAKNFGIKELTLYAFSLENFNQPKEELDYLMSILKKEFKKLLTDKRITNENIRINFIGKLTKVDSELQDIMAQVMEKTRKHSNYTVNFAVAYGGQQEVIDAVKKIAKQVKSGTLDINQINKDSFYNNMWLKSEPDLIIRTGGDKRTSNFLSFQSAYSEWIFLEKFWPEFEEQDFAEAVQEFSRRQRRFGA